MPGTLTISSRARLASETAIAKSGGMPMTAPRMTKAAFLNTEAVGDEEGNAAQ